MYFVYILTNKNNTVLYTGFTNDLERRVYEHKHKLVKGFTSKYNCDKLVYFEEVKSSDEALYRERQLKKYKREWKENLINNVNNEWRDLYEDFVG
jgi:putative endonuclease